MTSEKPMGCNGSTLAEMWVRIPLQAQYFPFSSHPRQYYNSEPTSLCHIPIIPVTSQPDIRYQFLCHAFDSTGNRTSDLAHTRPALYPFSYALLVSSHISWVGDKQVVHYKYADSQVPCMELNLQSNYTFQNRLQTSNCISNIFNHQRVMIIIMKLNSSGRRHYQTQMRK